MYFRLYLMWTVMAFLSFSRICLVACPVQILWKRHLKMQEKRYNCIYFGMEEDGEEIPEPTPVQDIKLEPHQTLAVIDAWMPPYRERKLNKSLNKTVTIPKWLDMLAKKEKVNYSHLLQDALKKYLGVENSDARHFSA